MVFPGQRGISKLWMAAGSGNCNLACSDNIKQNKETTTKDTMYYNVTMGCILATFVAAEKQKILHILRVCFSLRYPSWKVHAPYFRLWPVRLSSIFPLYLWKTRFSRKKILNTKCVFWFSLQLSAETSLILRRNEQDMIKNVYRSPCKVSVILVRL